MALHRVYPVLYQISLQMRAMHIYVYTHIGDKLIHILCGIYTHIRGMGYIQVKGGF